MLVAPFDTTRGLPAMRNEHRRGGHRLLEAGGIENDCAVKAQHATRSLLRMNRRVGASHCNYPADDHREIPVHHDLLRT